GRHGPKISHLICMVASYRADSSGLDLQRTNRWRWRKCAEQWRPTARLSQCRLNRVLAAFKCETWPPLNADAGSLAASDADALPLRQSRQARAQATTSWARRVNELAR